MVSKKIKKISLDCFDFKCFKTLNICEPTLACSLHVYNKEHPEEKWRDPCNYPLELFALFRSARAQSQAWCTFDKMYLIFYFLMLL